MIKSNILREILPSPLSPKFNEVLGTGYSGVSLDLRIAFNGSSRWGSSVKRTWCSCGYESATVDSTSWDSSCHTMVCPKCKKNLLFIEGGSDSDYLLKRQKIAATYISADKSTLKIVFQAIVLGLDLANSPVREKEELKYCKLSKEDEAVILELKKDSKGLIKVVKYIPSLGIKDLIISSEVKEFLGDLSEMAGTSGYVSIQSMAELTSTFPNVFNIDVYKNHPVIFKNAKDLFSEVVAKNPNFSIEEYFGTLGFNPNIFPLDMKYIASIKTGERRKIKETLLSPSGQLLLSRFKHGDEDISYIHFSYLSSFSSSEQSLLFSFLRECLDQYGISEVLKEFKKRCSKLQALGYEPNIENLRTRAYSKIVNGLKVKLKNKTALDFDFENLSVDSLSEFKP